MPDFYEGFTGKTPRKSAGFWRGALLGGVIGALLVATVLFYFAGTLLTEEKNGYNSLGLPREENAAENGEDNTVAPGAEQYYMSVVEAAERATPSVVGVSNYGIVFDIWGRGSLQERATGSGAIIDGGGYIVTNYHVIENARELVVTLVTGEELPATVVGMDPPTDLAVIKVDKTGLPAVELADSNELRVGEPAIAIGNPLGLDFQHSVTLGVVSARDRSITIQGQRFTFVQTDAAINEGNSGGALVNIYGRLIGINTAKIMIPGVEGMGFAIPSNTVREITGQLIEEGMVTRPWMGVYISTLTPMEARHLELAVEEGVLVNDILPGGPAEKAGMRAMDVIVAIDGKELAGSGDLQHIIYQYDIGQTVQVTIVRDGQEMVLDVVLEKMPEQVE